MIQRDFLFIHRKRNETERIHTFNNLGENQFGTYNSEEKTLTSRTTIYHPFPIHDEKWSRMKLLLQLHEERTSLIIDRQMDATDIHTSVAEKEE